MQLKSQKNSSWIIGVGMIVAAMFSCKGEDIYYQKFVSIPNSTWNAENAVSFDFEIEDTNRVYEFFFNLRNTNDYEYANLFLFWQLVSPDGRIKTDTSQFILANPDGRWLSKSVSGTVIENSMVFLRKSLPTKGKYSFSFKQGMREEKLSSIQDIGLKIKKYDE